MQITVCSNKWLVREGAGVSWENYFGNATSGKCDYADTPEKMKMLVSAGYATEKTIGEPDGTELIVLEYTSEYNPCCSVGNTKEFSVDITAVISTENSFVFPTLQQGLYSEVYSRTINSVPSGSPIVFSVAYPAETNIFIFSGVSA